MNVEKLNVQISANIEQFQKGISDVKKSLSGLTSDTKRIMNDVNSYITRNFGNIRVKNIIDSKSVQAMMLPITGLSGTLRSVTEQINEATGMIAVLQSQVKEFKGLGFVPDDINDLYEQLGRIQSIQEQLIEQREKLIADTQKTKLDIDTSPINEGAKDAANMTRNQFETVINTIQKRIQETINSLKTQLAEIENRLRKSPVEKAVQKVFDSFINYDAKSDTYEVAGSKGLRVSSAEAEAIAYQHYIAALQEANDAYLKDILDAQKFNDVLKEQQDLLNQVNKGLKDRAEVLDGAGKAVDDALKVAKFDASDEGKKSLEDILNLTKQIANEAPKAANVWGEIGTNIKEAVSGSVSGLPKQLGSIFAPLETANIVPVEGITTAIYLIATVVKKAIIPVIRKIDEEIDNTIQLALKGASTIAKTVSAFWTTIITGTKNFTSLIGQVVEKVDVLGNMFEKLQSFFSRLSKMISRVFVFTVFTKFFRTLRSEMSAYLSANKELMAELSALKGAWLTAFTPIYEAVLPIIQTLVHWITILGQKMAQLISIFTGKSVKSMGESAKALYDNAHAAEAAGSAAEEAKKQLMGFDQLNVLQDTSSSGGAGGGADVNAPDFSWAEDAEQFENFGDWLFHFFDDLVAKLPDINKALQDAADAINGFFKELNEGFQRQDALDKAVEFFTGLADALNDFVNRVDFPLIGEALANGLNFIMKSLNAFIDEFDWNNLGVQLAKGLNSFISNLDWAELGKLLVQKFNIIFETLAGFFSEFDWANLGSSLATGINSMVENINLDAFVTAFNEFVKGVLKAATTLVDNFNVDGFIKKFSALGNIDISGILTSLVGLINSIASKLLELVTKIDFAGIARKIATGLNDAIAKIDAATLGQLLAQLINQAFAFMLNFITTFDWKGLASKIAEFINNALSTINYQQIGTTLGELFMNAFRFLRDLIIKIDWIQLGKDVAGLINSAVSSINAGELATGINGICNALFQGIQSFLRELDWNKIKETIGELFARIDWMNILSNYYTIKEQIREAFWDAFITAIHNVNWAGVVAAIVEHLIQFVADVAKAFVEIGHEIGRGLLLGIAGIFIGIGKWFYDHLVVPIKEALGIHSPSTVFKEIGVDLIKGLLEGIKNTIKTVTDFFKNAFSNIKTEIVNKWNEVKTETSKKWNEIKNDVSTAINNMRLSVSTGINNIKTTITSKWDEIKTKTKTTWNDIKTSIDTTTNTIKSNLNSKLSDIKSNITSKWNEIKSNTSTTWNNIKTSLSTIWSNIKADTTTKLSGIKSDITTKWNEIKTNTTTTWNNIKKEISTIWTNIKSDVNNKVVELRNNLSTNWNNIKTTASNTWNDIKTTLTNTVSNIKTTVTNDFNILKSNVSKTWDTLKSEASTKWNSIKSSITSVASNISTSVQTTFNTMKNNLSTVFTNIGTSLSNALSGAQTKLSNIATTAQSTVSKVTSSVGSAVSNTFNSVGAAITSSKPYVTSYSYVNGHKYANYSDGTKKQLYASGGVVTRPTEAIIGEYANAATNPEIITPENKMRQVFKEVLGNQVNTPEMVNNILAAISRNTQAIIDKDTDVYLDKYKVNKTLNTTQKQQALLYQNII